MRSLSTPLFTLRTFGPRGGRTLFPSSPHRMRKRLSRRSFAPASCDIGKAPCSSTTADIASQLERKHRARTWMISMRTQLAGFVMTPPNHGKMDLHSSRNRFIGGLFSVVGAPSATHQLRSRHQAYFWCFQTFLLFPDTTCLGLPVRTAEKRPGVGFLGVNVGIILHIHAVSGVFSSRHF